MIQSSGIELISKERIQVDNNQPVKGLSSELVGLKRDDKMEKSGWTGEKFQKCYWNEFRQTNASQDDVGFEGCAGTPPRATKIQSVSRVRSHHITIFVGQGNG